MIDSTLIKNLSYVCLKNNRIKINIKRVFLNGNIKFINNNNLQPSSPIQNFTTNIISPFISQNNNTMSSEDSFILWTNTVNPVFEL